LGIATAERQRIDIFLIDHTIAVDIPALIRLRPIAQLPRQGKRIRIVTFCPAGSTGWDGRSRIASRTTAAAAAAPAAAPPPSGAAFAFDARAPPDVGMSITTASMCEESRSPARKAPPSPPERPQALPALHQVGEFAIPLLFTIQCATIAKGSPNFHYIARRLRRFLPPFPMQGPKRTGVNAGLCWIEYRRVRSSSRSDCNA